MARLSNEAQKVGQSNGIKETTERLSATKSYITVGALREKRKRERQNRKRGRN